MKILILHASAGAGHRRAAEALAKAFKLRDDKTEVKVCDILDHTPALFRRTYGKGYLELVRKAPELWGYMYAQSDKDLRVPWKRKLRSLFNNFNTPSFYKFYDGFQPDIAVCTHFMPLEMLSTKKRAGKLRAPLFCVVTDFAVHSLWMMQNVDCYYVATGDARRQIARRGQPEKDIQVTGIPIDPVFAQSLGQAEARREIGLDDKLPLVLLMSGGFGVGPTVELIRSLGASNVPCRILASAGLNEKLKQQIAAVAIEISNPVTIFGFVNNIHVMMDAADLIISKPGGLTTSEILAKGKPMMIIDPIPGQEQRNCEFLLEAGAAVRLFDIEDAGFKVQSLLADRKKLAQMQKNAKEIGRPHAARDIAQDILRRL